MTYKNTKALLKSIIADNFNCIAEYYDSAAVLHQEIGSRLIERLNLIKLNPPTILDLGSGTGQFSQALALKYPKATIIQLDISEKMLNLAKNACSSSKNTINNIEFHGIAADGEHIPLKNQSIDFVFSNGFLQYFSYPQNVLEEIFRILKPEGFLLFASFGPDTLKELRHAFKMLEQEYPIQTFSDMHDIGDILIKIGFEDPVMDLETLTLTYRTLDKLAEDLLQTECLSIPISPALITAYESLYKTEGNLAATFEIIYGLGFIGNNTPSHKADKQGVIRINADNIPLLQS